MSKPNDKASGEKRIVRCAIYTRKSTEEGLEQEFNSLDAQRESGEAYVASPEARGLDVPARPLRRRRVHRRQHGAAAVQRLLADIEAGKVDCVVVYKVDRLSRSLLDFARIMEAFDKHNVSFVSVTQQFNTTHVDGPVDAQRPAVLRPVRAGDHLRADAGQDRGGAAEGQIGRRQAASWATTCSAAPPAPS